MLISIVNMILPIFVTFMIGVGTRKLSLIDESGCRTLKTLVSRIMLPVILVNAFMFADYSANSVVIMVVFFIAMTLVLGIGFLLRRTLPDRARYMPFVIATIEGGTIGYPLAAMLYGTIGTSNMAVIDVGHTVFLFMIAVPVLQAVDGSKPDFKGILKNAITSPTFDAMLLGILLGASGAGSFIAASPFGSTWEKLVSFLTAPAGMLILIALGYDLSIKKDLLKSVVCTSFMRVLVMGVLCALSALVIFHFIPFEKEKLVILILAFALPGSYAIPLFSEFPGHKDYVSTTISFSTVLTFVIFTALTVYAFM